MKLYFTPTPHMCRHMWYWDTAPVFKMEGRYVSLIDIRRRRCKPREPWSPGGSFETRRGWRRKRYWQYRSRMRRYYGYQEQYGHAP